MVDWKRLFAEWKLRYDISISFLALFNFFLLAVTASTPIQAFLQDRLGWAVEQYTIVLGLVAFIIGSIFIFGLILDRVVDYWQNMSTQQNQRNPQMIEILDRLKRIEDKLKPR